jgi:peroxiredoxin
MGTFDTWVRLLVCLVPCLSTSGCASGDLASAARSSDIPLTTAEGTRTTLQALSRNRAATVLVFWSGGCPCVRRYQQRVDDLLDRYPAERVQVLGVSSNAGEDYADVLRIARERGVRIPIVRDEHGELARSIGVHSTPTAVVIGGDGRVRFLGWIDNERLPGDPQREPWLDRAIEGLLDNRAFANRTPTYGCTITRSLFHPSASSCCHESAQGKQ